jgi:ABC-type Fe3+/spermidine/putrescine transport system ATPase subunit
MNIFSSRFQSGNGDGVTVETSFGALVGQSTSSRTFAAGDNCMLGIRPEDVEIDGSAATDGPNLLNGTVISSDYVGEGFIHTVAASGESIRIKRHHKEAISKGDTVRLRFPPSQTVVVTPAESLISEDLEGGLAGEGASRAG